MTAKAARIHVINLQTELNQTLLINQSNAIVSSYALS